MVGVVAKADRTIPSDGAPIHLFKFPPECVAEVILGCQMTETKKAEIHRIVAQKYPAARIFEASMSETAFDLDIKQTWSR
jgi:hypothetical protein